MMFGHGMTFNHKGIPTTRPTSAKIQDQLLQNKRKPVGTTYDTTYANWGWFDYMDFNYSSATGVIYYFDVYPDSNLIDPVAVSSTSDGNIWCHGMGMSFDPTDGGYYTGASTLGTPVGSGDAFTIDSFQMVDKYIMNNTSLGGLSDSLIIDFIVSDPSMNGAYDLHYSPASVGAYTVIAADDTPREFVADYMPNNWTVSPPFSNDCWDSISTPVMERFAIPLTAAIAGDTGTNGDHITDFALTQYGGHNLYVAAGQKVMVYAHFKSAVAYANGTSCAAANYYHIMAGDPTGIIPQQTTGSYNTGLISQQQNAYGFPTYGGHNLLFSPADFYSATQPGPFGFEVPYMMFYLGYPGTITTGVSNIINAESVKASPNPTSNVVNISFSLTTNADVTATLTNMTGQVVATQTVANATKGTVQFSTAALPSGVYFYTLNANGQHTTGKIAVAH